MFANTKKDTTQPNIQKKYIYDNLHNEKSYFSSDCGFNDFQEIHTPTEVKKNETLK